MRGSDALAFGSKIGMLPAAEAQDRQVSDRLVSASIEFKARRAK
jgi:hypothetical protein